MEWREGRVTKKYVVTIAQLGDIKLGTTFIISNCQPCFIFYSLGSETMQCYISVILTGRRYGGHGMGRYYFTE